MKRQFLLLSVLFLAVAITPVPGLCDYDITCIDPNGSSPDINNQGHIVWQSVDPAGSDLEIFLYDGNSTIQMTTNDTNDEFPRINDSGQIAWIGRGTLFPSDEQIHFYNGSAIEKLTDDTWWKDNLELNSQGQMTWDGLNFADGNDYEIFFYDGTVQRLTTNVNGLDDYQPRINDSGELVWQGKVGNALQDLEIFFYDGTVHQLTDDTSHQVNPDINNSSHLVYEQQNAGGYYDIFYDDGSTITNIDEDNPRDFGPLINDSGHVAWLKEKNGGPDWDLYLYDGSDVVYVHGNVAPLSHHISNGYVAWAAADGGDWDIFVSDGTTTTQLTSDAGEDWQPRVSDSGAVVWQSENNGVCLAEIAVPPPPMAPAVYYPATGEVHIPEVLIEGTPKAYSVVLQQLGGPGYFFRVATGKKTPVTGNAGASFNPVTGVLTIILLEIDGRVRTWWARLQRQPAEGYEFELMKAGKN